MKKAVVLVGIFCFLQGFCFAQELVQAHTLKISDVVVYKDGNLFGLKDKQENVVVEAQYKKLIRVGESSFIIQKGARFGMIDLEGNVIVKPKYRNVERVFGKYVKLGNDNDFGLRNEHGEILIPHEYSLIEPLFGKKFLTCKKYKYGIVDESGKTLLENDFDDIYMPNPDTLRVRYDGEWFQIERWAKDSIELPDEVQKVEINDEEFKVTRLAVNTGLISGYSALTVTDYALKFLSSISPAYEETIDELMFSQGLETVSIFVKFSWIPKFPFTYAKNYYQNIVNPNNGILSGVRNNLKRQIK